MAISFPAIDLSPELDLQCAPGEKTFLFSRARRLVVSSSSVLIFNGATMTRKLIFDEPIVSATYTRFPRLEESDSEALVVCLSTSAHIHYPGGNTYTVNFPFTVRHAFSFDSGILLERDQSHDSRTAQHASSNSYRFFSLSDPLGDLRSVTTSSTSVVASAETLMEFPAQGLGKTRSLCATFNSRTRTIQIYHIKSSARNTLQTNGSTYRSRKSHSMATPNPTKILEDDILHDQVQGSISSNFSHFLSISMDKKRTSTLLSGASSIARMGSEASFPDSTKPNPSKAAIEFGSLRKDMILSHVDSISLDARRSHLSVYGLSHDDKEAIVVSNSFSKTTNVYIYKHQTSRMTSHESIYTFQCQHAHPLNHPEFHGWLVVVLNPSTLQLVHPFLDVRSPPLNIAGKFPPIANVLSTCENVVALKSANKKCTVLLISLVLEPQSKLVSTCLKAWKYLSGSKLNEHVWTSWRASLMLDDSKDEWKAFVVTLLSFIYPFKEYGEICEVENEITACLPNAKLIHDYFSVDYSFLDLLPYIVASLHIIYEETKLDCLSSQELQKLGTLLTQVTIWMSWPEQWTNFYMIDHKGMDMEQKLVSVVLLYDPPNFFHCITQLLEGSRVRYPKFSQLVEESSDVDMIITPRSHIVYRLFEILASSSSPPNDVVKEMCEYGLDVSDLESFPLGISIPLKECFSICKESPASEWNHNALELVGRKDLTMLLSSSSQIVNMGDNSISKSFISGKDSSLIVNSIFSKSENLIAWDGQSEADRIRVTKLIFDQDRRFYEITKLLHQTRTQTVLLPPHAEITEYEVTVMKRELAALVALRTLSIPLGRAALFYGGRMPFLTEKYPISKFNLNALIAPSMTSIVFSEKSVNSKVMEWGHFHNGVSSGLSISPHSNGITGSWVIFNKPLENNAQHAGFLLGLGLNGHLKKLEEWHIYNYLGPKHPLTSVGLLIGMAASLRGSMDHKLTKVLSVHAVAMLPQGANDLNVPIIVQSAGLIGIGLLYLETQHRRMSEILLSQIGGRLSHIEDDEEQEGYRLSAGIALGLINLGKGDDLRGLNDTHVVDRLLGYAVTMRDSHPIFESDKSGSGAVIALGFIYMKTRSVTVAKKLEIPPSEQMLDYIKPDLLLLRCLMKNLIMWDPIESSISWVESQIPDILSKFNIKKIKVLDSDQIAFFHILGGSCLSLAIKFSSSHNLEARNTILYYLDSFMQILMADTTNYDQMIAFNGASQMQSLLALCASIVMAGSGDLEVFRRLRVLYGRVNRNVKYGNHLAVNMALGILFLGGSQYTFGDSNFAIASLLISLYPVFPNGEGEHEVHLQALRHFWALAVEPKCLVVRDVNDGKPIKVPVSITYMDGKMEETMTPCLLPRMTEIACIEVEGKEYFDVKIDFQMNSSYLEKFKKSLTIYVYKKRNYELLKASVHSLFNTEKKILEVKTKETPAESSIKKMLELGLMQPFSSFEKRVFLQEACKNEQEIGFESMGTNLSVFDVFDAQTQLNRMASNPKTVEDLRNLNLLFAYMDNLLNSKNHYLPWDFVERLKSNIWRLTQSAD
ncbi:putative Negative regulator of mitosis [Clavispora lusitaniae]|uniref:Negative regulator of mitosis n=1 Tax=Clavispora lusitaniae TaxID=36911 RepID=A0ACD0WPA9_CLALS|nr:putative Negative regulator of mitosis [Clavispora lusitaniae]QFZ34788.1 putative Negative regulator of mitosis [Clavispora lusitaniae]QFZ40473.1 putative Negative regulator of mitosis [Clavispora lusitaniae]QFZ46153.1 putative Negative regulator of mitosis [Clavispora lusitaniae]QFZ51815.1 putative Negative regulator of mitosis [Clavispora lusitaniae]